MEDVILIALSNKLLEEAMIVAFIPRYKINRKVVIKEIPEYEYGRSKKNHRRKNF